MRKLFVTGVAVLSFALLGTQALAKNDGDIRPGWGFGDKNHVHVGPPGHSVHATQNNQVSSEVNLSVEANNGGNSVSNSDNSSIMTDGANVGLSVNVSGGGNSQTATTP